MAQFDSPLSIWDDPEIVWDDLAGALLAYPPGYINFSTSSSIEGRTELSSITSLSFTSSPTSIDGKAFGVGIASIAFDYEPPILSGTTDLISGSSLDFSHSATLRGATFMSGATHLEFLDGVLLGARGELLGDDFLLFSTLPLTVIGRFQLYGLNSLAFTSSSKSYRSPWQGVSEYSFAVRNNENERANYGRLPYLERLEE